MAENAVSGGVKSLPFLIGVLIIISLAILGVLAYVAYAVNSSLTEIYSAISPPEISSRANPATSDPSSLMSRAAGDKAATTPRGAASESPALFTPVFSARATAAPNPYDAEPTARGLADKMRAYDDAAPVSHSHSSRREHYGLDAGLAQAKSGRAPARRDDYEVDTSAGGEDGSSPRRRRSDYGLDAGVSRRKRPQATPRVALDATVLGATLYVLDEEGNVSAKSLLSSESARARVCRIERPPAPFVAIDALKGELVGRTRNGEVFVLQPCSDPTCSRDRRSECEGSVARWKRPKVALGTSTRSRSTGATLNNDEEEVDLTNVTHMSTSPDGRRLWVQDSERGRLFEIGEGGAWVPLGDVQRNGNENVARVIGPNGDFVDILNGRAVRNQDIATMRAGVENVVYPGGEHGARPVFTERGRKRVAVGVVATFPCSVDELTELCAPTVSA